MTLGPTLCLLLGGAFAVACLCAYVQTRSREEEVHWDILLLAAIVAVLAVVLSMHPQWLW